MSGEEFERKRILQDVQAWFRRRKILGSTAKGFEVAALVAESEADGIYDATAMKKEQRGAKIERLRKLGEDFRSEAEEVPRAEREL